MRLLFITLFQIVLLGSAVIAQKEFRLNSPNRNLPGKLVEMESWCDTEGYLVIHFRFQVDQYTNKKSVFRLIHPDGTEIASHEFLSNPFLVNGFSSSTDNFTIYFTTVSSSIQSRHFLFLNKLSRMNSVLSDWPRPDINTQFHFDYSYNNKHYVVSLVEKENRLGVYEIVNPDSIHVSYFDFASSMRLEISEIMPGIKSSALLSHERFGRRDLNLRQVILDNSSNVKFSHAKIFPFRDSLLIRRDYFSIIDENNVTKFIKFNFTTGKLTFQNSDYKTPTNNFTGLLHLQDIEVLQRKDPKRSNPQFTISENDKFMYAVIYDTTLDRCIIRCYEK